MTKTKRANALMYVVLIIVSLISVFPLYWMLISATNKSIDVSRGTMLPGTAFFDNLKALFAAQPVQTAMFSAAKLLNTTIAFILPTISTPFLIMMFRQSARSFPHDIIEAARIDGLNEVQIFFSQNHILFEFNDTIVVSRLIEGEYFRISQMLSSDYETKIQVNKKEFLDCIERATILIRENDKKPLILKGKVA